MSSLAPLRRFAQDEYGRKARRIRGVRRTKPSDRGWGSGWPDCQTGKIVRIVITRPRDGKQFRPAAREEIAPLAAFLFAATFELGALEGVSYEIRGATETDGGLGSFACRQIKRSNPPAPSWHSWALAWDINTRSNPFAKAWRATNPPWMVKLWESAGFFWGGRYPASSWYHDPMHFEYLGKIGDVGADLTRAKAAYTKLVGELGPASEPQTPEPDELAQLKARVVELEDEIVDLEGSLDHADVVMGITIDAAGELLASVAKATSAFTEGTGIITPEGDPE